MFKRCKAKIEGNITKNGNLNSKLTLVNITHPSGITIKKHAVYHYRAGQNILGRLKKGDFIEFEGGFEADELELVRDCKITGTSDVTAVNVGVNTVPQGRKYFTRLANGDLREIKEKKGNFSYDYPSYARKTEKAEMNYKDKLGLFFDLNMK